MWIDAESVDICSQSLTRSLTLFPLPQGKEFKETLRAVDALVMPFRKCLSRIGCAFACFFICLCACQQLAIIDALSCKIQLLLVTPKHPAASAHGMLGLLSFLHTHNKSAWAPFPLAAALDNRTHMPTQLTDENVKEAQPTTHKHALISSTNAYHPPPTHTDHTHNPPSHHP